MYLIFKRSENYSTTVLSCDVTENVLSIDQNVATFQFSTAAF